MKNYSDRHNSSEVAWNFDGRRSGIQPKDGFVSEFEVQTSETNGANVIERPPVIKPPVMQQMPEAVETDRPARRRSWVFRIIDFIGSLASRLFGIASVIFLLAVAANIPILQFLSFGYLLEVTGRLARGQKVRKAFIGLTKATRIGSAVLGAWLLLIPVRFASQFWLEAYLIDPTSQATRVMRIVQIVLIVLTVAHIGAAWFCGGKLRYFFWPIVAPFSFMVWTARRFAGSSFFRKLLGITVGWLSPSIVDDICGAQPISDWFLPAIFWKKIRHGGAYQAARDGVWDFFASLNLPYYFVLGLKGFIGTCLWLFIPTSLLVMSTNLEGPMAVLTGVFGSLIAIPVFSILPFVQAHYAVDGKFRRFAEPRAVIRNMGRAPFAHILALLLTLVFALPLFLLKVEEIPTELLWTLSIVFVVFTWPAKFVLGWAYHRGTKREERHRWWIRYPVFMLAGPISFSFVLILFFTRYITWNGAWSLVENHVFLLPAPFWLSLFT